MTDINTLLLSFNLFYHDAVIMSIMSMKPVALSTEDTQNMSNPYSSLITKSPFVIPAEGIRDFTKTIIDNEK